MKKVIIALILFTASSMIVNAQFEKGSIIVGVSSALNLYSSGSGSGIMSLGFSSVTSTVEYIDGDFVEEWKERSFNFQPRGGYFFMDNMAAGAGIIYARSASKTEATDVYGESTETQTIIAFEPYYRYYLPMDKITPFCEANVAIGSLKDKGDNGFDGPFDYTHSLFSYGVGVGASFPIGMNAAFDVMAGYKLVKTKWEEGDNKETYKVGGLGLQFGFVVFIGGYGSSANDSY